MEQRTTDICPRCGKRRYLTWTAAAKAARQVRRHRDLRVIAYHSRRCACFHVGGINGAKLTAKGASL